MNYSVKDDGSRAVLVLFPPTTVTALLWSTSANDVSLLSWLSALFLLVFSWGSYCVWKSKRNTSLPLFSLLAFMYWIYYAIPLFWGNRKSLQSAHAVSSQTIDRAMLLAILGVACLWFGIKSGVGRHLAPRKVADIDSDGRSSQNYINFIVLLGTVSSFFEESMRYTLGEGGRQFIIFLTSFVPTVAFAQLFRRFLQGKSSSFEKALIGLFLITRVLIGLSSGWLGHPLMLFVICCAIYVQERGKIPALSVALLLSYVLFFQPAKEAFRKAFWTRGSEASTTERISFWTSQSIDKWSAALSEPSSEGLRGLAVMSLGRLSLLQQSSNVLDMTPQYVPYQYGHTYSYMLVTLIPRVLWPEKPSMNEANRFYQVAYGITQERDLEKVSIAVGTLTESYINFGWMGPLLVMIPLGFLFDFYQTTFLEGGSGHVFNAIGVALIPAFMGIESQLAQYLGGVVQAIAISLLVLVPVLHVRLRRRLIPRRSLRRCKIEMPNRSFEPPGRQALGKLR